MADQDIPWTDQIDDAPIICASPIDALIADTERQHREFAEVLGADHTAVRAMQHHLDRLVEARNRAARLDEWMPVTDIVASGLADVTAETIHRRCRDGDIPRESWRMNRINGKREIHVETIARMLGTEVDDVRRRRRVAAEAA